MKGEKALMEKFITEENKNETWSREGRETLKDKRYKNRNQVYARQHNYT